MSRHTLTALTDTALTALDVASSTPCPGAAPACPGQLSEADVADILARIDRAARSCQDP